MVTVNVRREECSYCVADSSMSAVHVRAYIVIEYYVHSHTLTG